MKTRGLVLGTVLALLGIPVALAAVEAVSFYLRNRADGSIVSSGVERYYRLYVPSAYRPGRPVPLVISMHGAGLWGAAQQAMSQWDRVAEREGFIVVHPSGRGGSGPKIWRPDDVRFIADLIDSLSAAYTIDPSRIYANGLSNGGGMSFVLSCTMPDRIAAVGLVASAQTLPWRWCTDTNAVPMMAIHGTADRATPYHGGKSWIMARRAFPSIPLWTVSWARRNRCSMSTVDSVIVPTVVRREYRNCARGADVVLITIEGGGHTWPGGGPAPEWFVGPTSRALDASSVLWEFFRDHPLAGARTPTQN